MWEKTCRLIACYLFINETRACDTKLCGSLHVTLCEARNIQNPMAHLRYISQAVTPLPSKEVLYTLRTRYLFCFTHAFTRYFAQHTQTLNSVRHSLLLLIIIKRVFTLGIYKLYCSGYMYNKIQLSFQFSLLTPVVLNGLPCNRDF